MTNSPRTIVTGNPWRLAEKGGRVAHLSSHEQVSSAEFFPPPKSAALLQFPNFKFRFSPARARHSTSNSLDFCKLLCYYPSATSPLFSASDQDADPERFREGPLPEFRRPEPRLERSASGQDADPERAERAEGQPNLRPRTSTEERPPRLREASLYAASAAKSLAVCEREIPDFATSSPRNFQPTQSKPLEN